MEGEREFGVRRGPAEDLGAVPAGHDGPGPGGGRGLDEVVVEPLGMQNSPPVSMLSRAGGRRTRRPSAP